MPGILQLHTWLATPSRHGISGSDSRGTHFRGVSDCSDRVPRKELAGGILDGYLSSALQVTGHHGASNLESVHHGTISTYLGLEIPEDVRQQLQNHGCGGEPHKLVRVDPGNIEL